MRKLKGFLLLVICMLTVSVGFAQKELKEEAAYFFENKEYRKAYDAYDKLYAQNPKNMDYKFRFGYSALFAPEKKLRAIEIFEDLKRTDNSPEVDYYLAKAFHINYRFDDAIASYNK